MTNIILKVLFGNFFFPDGSQPDWNSLSWLQKRFMKWFNKERTRTVLTFPVETMALLTKDGDVLEKYLEVDTFLFDKTGTITTSYPLVEKVLPFGDYTEKDILRISACLEEHIYHPIANAIVKQAEIEGIEHEEMHGKLQYVASKGIKSQIDGQSVVIGNYVLMQDEQVRISSEQLALIEQYKTHYNLLFLAYKKELIGMFCIHTPLRSEAKVALKKLKRQGKKLILATGDTLARTEELVKDLPFDNVYTDLKPDGKFQLVHGITGKLANYFDGWRRVKRLCCLDACRYWGL